MTALIKDISKIYEDKDRYETSIINDLMNRNDLCNLVAAVSKCTQ